MVEEIEDRIEQFKVACAHADLGVSRRAPLIFKCSLRRWMFISEEPSRCVRRERDRRQSYDRRRDHQPSRSFTGMVTIGQWIIVSKMCLKEMLRRLAQLGLREGEWGAKAD